MQKYFSGSNPPLKPDTVILKLAPQNDLRGFRKNSFNFYQLNGIVGYSRLNHPAQQKVFLFVRGLDRRPFAQQQFLRTQGIHGVLINAWGVEAWE